jgi:hypothetical protein
MKKHLVLKFALLALAAAVLSLGLTACKCCSKESSESEHPAKSEHPKKAEHPEHPR